jgi:transposase
VQLKTILNRVEKQRSFVYGEVRLIEQPGLAIEVEVQPRANSRPRCSGCGRRRPGYDRLSERRFEFVPLKKVARMLRNHRELILNWFRARGAISSAAVEGFNNKAKLTMRKAYGFRTDRAMELALYHTLGSLPEPVATHRFC